MRYDVIIIGAGPGGYAAAIKAAQLGLKAALIEKSEPGGTCLNRGCIPTKALIHSAEAYRNAKDFEKIGVITKELSFDINRIHAYKDSVVQKLRDGIESLLKSNKVDLYYGEGEIVTPNSVRLINETSFTFDTENIIISTGTVPSVPKISGMWDGDCLIDGVMDSDAALNSGLFKRLVIIGGGVIGIEFAGIYSALDCEVTIIESMPRVLPLLDREISQSVSMLYKNKGIKIFTSSQVHSVTKNADELLCSFMDNNENREILCDGILVCTGRKTSLQKLIPRDLNIETNNNRIVTNEFGQTNIEGIYAIGDVTEKIQLAHSATAQGVIAVSHIASQKGVSNASCELKLDWTPSCVYTNPEIATVGMSADDAKKAGIKAKTGKYIMTSNGRNMIEGNERGFMKLVFEADSRKLLGAQLFCYRATDMIGEIAMAGANGLTVDDMLKTIHPHPSFSEGIGEALENVFGKSIHSL